MASPTKRTKLIRKRKRSRAGTTRKRKLRTNGSTKSQEELFAESEK